MSNKKDKETEKQLKGDNSKYKLMVQVLTSDPRYAKSLADVSKPSQHDKLANALISVTWPIGASLPIIYALVQLEFERKHTHPFTILRVNSIVSKMMGRFTKKVGDPYLELTLGKPIRDLNANQETIDCEVDASRLQGNNNDVEEQVKTNLANLTQQCQIFIDSITSEENLKQCPREIRAICNYMAFMGKKYKLEYDSVILPLVSGFVMLRYICPAITLPQNCGIMSAMPGPKTRKNCTYIAKVLQKLANGEKFESQEPHLLPMNDFIEKNKEKLFNYLRNICIDPLEHQNEEPFSDLIKTVTFEDLHQRQFDTQDLLFIHRLIYEHGYDLIVGLQNEILLTEDRRPVSLVSTESDFLKLVAELGPPPLEEAEAKRLAEEEAERKKKEEEDKKKKGKKGKDEKPAEEPAKPLTMRQRTEQENHDILVQKSLENLLANTQHFDLGDLERARFLYIGKPSKENVPVVYLIMHRVTNEFLSKVDLLLVHIHKVLGKIMDNPFFLVMDLSWCNMTDEFQASLYKAVIGLSRLMRKSDIDNIQRLFIIHPNRKTWTGVQDVLNIIPPETFNQIVRVAHEWSDLGEILDPPSVYVPFVSKKFVPLTYNIVKINESNKKKDRLIKITNDTVLNLDPRTGTIQNEILLKSIDEIRLKADTELTLRFLPESEEEWSERGPNSFIKHSKAPKPTVRRFLCYSPQQRELIVESMFEYAVRSSSLELPQVFETIKVGKADKRTPRTLKLTADSILNFRDGLIRREIPYSTINSFYLNQSDRGVLYINFLAKGVEKTYTIESKVADTIKDALLDAMNRFKSSIDLEIELFRHKDVDTIFQRFYSEVNSKRKNMQLYEPQKIVKALMDQYNELSGGKGIQSSISVEKLKEIATSKLGFSNSEATYICHKLDRERKKKIYYDDFIQGWLYAKKQKALCEKRKDAALAAQQAESAAKKNKNKQG